MKALRQILKKVNQLNKNEHQKVAVLHYQKAQTHIHTH